METRSESNFHDSLNSAVSKKGPLLALLFSTMPALDDEFRLRRQRNAQSIEACQRATALAIEEFHAVRRAPVPYKPTMEAPVVHWIVPSDDHLVSTGQLKKKLDERKVTPPHLPSRPKYLNADQSAKMSSEQFSRSIFGNTLVVQPEKGAANIDIDQLITKHNEWSLQKNGYDPDIAARMRIDVRKSAALAVSVLKPGAEVPNQSSNNIYYAFGIKHPPTDLQVPLDLNATFPIREHDKSL